MSLNLSPCPSAARLIIFCARALLSKSSIILFWPYWGAYPSQQKGSLYHRKAVHEVDGFIHYWGRIALTSPIHADVPGASTYMAQNAATTTSSAAKTIMGSEWWSKRQDLDLLCWEVEEERPIFVPQKKKKQNKKTLLLLTLCGSVTVRASEEDREENSMSLEQDSALHHCPEIL